MYVFLILAVAALVSSKHSHITTTQIKAYVDGVFGYLDSNPKDGVLDIDEIIGVFERYDQNSDNMLDLNEYNRYSGTDQSVPDQIFHTFDKSGDNLLSESEYLNGNFAQADTDNDNVVSRAEFDNYFTQVIHHAIQVTEHGHGDHDD